MQYNLDVKPPHHEGKVMSLRRVILSPQTERLGEK